MPTIARTSSRKITALKATIVAVKFYDQQTGDMKPTTMDAAFGDLYRYDFSKLVDNGNGTYNVNVHGNLWYVLHTQDALDRLAARAAERTAFAVEMAQAVRDNRAEHAAHNPERAAQVPVAPAKPSAPAAAMTRTRVAVTTQIVEACDTLGIEFDTYTSVGVLTFTVHGKDYTPSELADLVLEGGFLRAYGRNVTVPVAVNPFTPLELRKATMFANVSTPALVASLPLLAVAPDTEETRMVRAWTIEEIERRFPEAGAAAEAAFDEADRLLTEEGRAVEVDYVAVILAALPADIR